MCGTCVSQSGNSRPEERAAKVLTETLSRFIKLRQLVARQETPQELSIPRQRDGCRDIDDATVRPSHRQLDHEDASLFSCRGDG